MARDLVNMTIGKEYEYEQRGDECGLCAFAQNEPRHTKHQGGE